MSAYIEIIRKQFKISWNYRANFWLHILGGIFHYFIMVNIWQALYHSRETVAGVDLQQMITYTLVTAVLSSVSGNGMTYTIADEVQSGEIGNTLSRPISYKGLHIAQGLGGNLMELLCVTLPTVVLMGAAYGLRWSAAPLNTLLFILSGALGAVIMYSVSFLFGVISFWTKTSMYAAFLMGACLQLFAGRMVPLWFYPAGLRAVAQALPFRFITFEPLAIYLGQYDTAGALRVIFIQCLWMLGLLLLERLLWGRIQKHLVIQGG